MSDIRFGIIGCGNIARAHMWALKNGSGITCAGITDRIAAHAAQLNEEFGGGFRVFDSALDMVTSPDIDAVILAVPNYQHQPMFELAAAHGKHIMCEKPLTMTVEQGEQMVRTAREYGVKTQMGLCTRFEPYVDAMMDHIKAGNLGDIYFARTDVLRMRGTPTGWFGNKEKSGGGPLIDIGVHYIDACWYLMGKPKRVAAIFNATCAPQGEDNAVAVIEFEGGAIGVLETGFVTPFARSPIEIQGTQGSLTIQGGKVSIRSNKLTEAGTVTVERLPKDMPQPLRQWIDAVEYGKDIFMDMDKAIALTELLENEYVADKTETVVHI